MHSDNKSTKPLIYDFNFDELGNILSDSNQPSYRSKQIWEGLYKQLWTSFDQFSTLPKEFRNFLLEQLSFTSLKLSKIVRSKDANTVKSLFHTSDTAAVESVLMRYRKRNSLCVSTQSGCSMGCTLCATGQMGFIRNLTSGEIIEQVIHAAVLLKQYDEQLTNIIVMGMGEPFLNYMATLKAIDILNDDNGFKMGERRFTISTVGIVPGIYQICKDRKQINLAVSLHAANNELRSSLIPVNRKYPLEVLMNACHEYVNITHRRLTFEWVLIDGVNDSPEDARELVNLVRGLLCHVNLIPLNPTTLYPGKSSPKSSVDAFYQIIKNSGLPCSIRVRRGLDIQAGCGQLAASGD